MGKYPEFILLNVGYKELNANWNWNQICSPFTRIYYVQKGKARTRIDNVVYDLRPNCFYLIPPFTQHDDICDGLFGLYYLHFYEKTVREESLFDKYYFPIELEASIIGNELMDRLLQLNPDRYLRHIDPQIYDNAVSFRRFVEDDSRVTMNVAMETQGILYQIMAGFVEKMHLKSANQDERVFEAVQYIHEHINQNISVSQLANLSCLTSDHFIRLFRKEIGQTPLKYINQKKVERAQVLLATSDQAICQIALELSLDNVSYFNRLFRQHAGKTPTEFRNEHFSI